MSKGRPRDEDKVRQWRERIREWRTSGMSVRAYCQWIGVSEPTFYSWRRELDQSPADTSAFVPVHVVPDRVAGQDSPLEIVLAGGRSVRIAAGFDAATLRQLLAVLEEPC